MHLPNRFLLKLGITNSKDLINNKYFRLQKSGDCEAETLILLVNAGDTPCRASVYPALFREGPDANKPLPFAGVYRDADGGAVTARDTLCCTIPPVSAMILQKS